MSLIATQPLVQGVKSSVQPQQRSGQSAGGVGGGGGQLTFPALIYGVTQEILWLGPRELFLA